jgi:hypothetical protein
MVHGGLDGLPLPTVGTTITKPATITKRPFLLFRL